MCFTIASTYTSVKFSLERGVGLKNAPPKPSGSGAHIITTFHLTALVKIKNKSLYICREVFMHKCKVCASGVMQQPEGKQYRICNVCNASEILYKPQAHQAQFHNDPHTFKAIFGAYGSGKTTTAVIELIRHALSVPNGLSAMLAPTMQMLKETSYLELLKFLPHTHIVAESKTRGSEYIVLRNGHKILLLPSNDADKIRSLNLSAFYLEEASNAKFDVFIELTARTRNKAALTYATNEDGTPAMLYDKEAKVYRQKIKKSRLLGIICSNPDVGWIRSEILLKSDKVFSDTIYPKHKDHNPFLSTHLHSSYQNKYLDPDFQMRIGRGKPEWWVKRYIYGSFDYSEGLVYPSFSESIVEPFTIPGSWKRMFSVDFGLRDPTVMLAGAIDPEENVLYIYDEHYQAESPVPKHAAAMQKMLAEVPPGLIHGQVIADPAGEKRSGASMRSYFNHYAEYGLWFKPGNNAIEAGIMKVFTYFSLKRLYIFSNCVNLITEGRAYKYKEDAVDSGKNRGEKPVDANNHAMDALRYMIMELPDDPDSMATAVYEGNSKSNFSSVSGFKWPKALETDDELLLEDWYGDF